MFYSFFFSNSFRKLWYYIAAILTHFWVSCYYRWEFNWVKDRQLKWPKQCLRKRDLVPFTRLILVICIRMFTFSLSCWCVVDVLWKCLRPIFHELEYVHHKCDPCQLCARPYSFCLDLRALFLSVPIASQKIQCFSMFRSLAICGKGASQCSLSIAMNQISLVSVVSWVWSLTVNMTHASFIICYNKSLWFLGTSFFFFCLVLLEFGRIRTTDCSAHNQAYTL